MDGFYSSSLTLSGDGSVLTDNVYGVYQCFSNDGVWTIREVSLVRVLPYGELTLSTHCLSPNAHMLSMDQKSLMLNY